MKRIERLGAAAVLALGVGVLYMFVRHILGSSGALRFRVESWALVFLAVGFTLRLVRSRQLGHEPTRPAVFPPGLWVGFCVLSIALYWPALSAGMLASDSVLVAHASRWSIGPVTPAFFRPVPLFIWGLLVHLGAGATSLHLLNLLLHGTNAYLATRVIAGWVQDHRWSVLGGLLVLTAPLAPEAVVWLSGVFDLLATALVLTCILIARRYDDHPSVTTRLLFVGVGIVAVASKETAAIAGGLVLLDAWVRNARSRPLLVDTGILIVTVGIVGLVRLGLAFGVASPPVSKYALQLALFRSFGALAVPWHIDVIQRLPWLPILGVVAVVYLLTAFFLEPAGSKKRTKLAIAASAWVLLSIAPVFPILFIAPELQQSRHLYMAGIGWAGLIAALASEQRRIHLQSSSLAAVGALVAIASGGTVLHLGYVTERLGPVATPEAAGPTPLEVRQALLNELQPVTLENCTLRRFGGPNDGGYLVCENLLKNAESAYSYGIAGEDNWGCDLSRQSGMPVHQYDCFDTTAPVCKGGRFVFHAECIGNEAATVESRPFDTLANQISKNGDAGKRLIVKMDVEGAEWDSLLATPDAVLDRIEQMPMELHGTDDRRFLELVQKLKRTFHLVHLHFNNYACTPAVAPFPAFAYQVLWVNKRIGIHDVSAPGPTLPNPADAPDNPAIPDCQLTGVRNPG